MNIRVFFIIITQFTPICTFIVSIKSLKEINFSLFKGYVDAISGPSAAAMWPSAAAKIG